ncbi:PO22 protein, partial [Sitta europaea]|nr:PO22 protein [Sitta europaea]
GERPAWIGNEVLKELRNKKRMYCLWKEGQVSQEVFKGIVRACRKKIREAKTQLELNLATFVKNNKKFFCKYIDVKRAGKTNLCSVLDEGGNFVTAHEEKAELLNAFFTLVFNGKTVCPQDNCHPGLCSSLSKHHLDIHKFMGTDGIHPRELADELVKLLSIIYQLSWLIGEVPDDWKLANVMPIHKKGGKEDPSDYRPVSPTSVPGKITEHFVLSAIMQNLQDGQGTSPSQHGFRRGRSSLTNLIFFYEQVTHLVDEEKAVDVVYLDFSIAFDTISHSTLLQKLAANILDRCTL